MTRFTVVWHDAAQNELARIWLDAIDRAAITNAANTIDHELSTDATEKGTTTENEVRELVVAPLRVLFGVSGPDRLVKVVQVAVL